MTAVRSNTRPTSRRQIALVVPALMLAVLFAYPGSGLRAIEPAPWQRDVRVALTVHALLRDGFAHPRTVGQLLQVPASEAEEALDVVASCTIDAEAAIRSTSGGIWLPASSAVRCATQDPSALLVAQRRGLLTWWRPDPDGTRRLVTRWLAVTDRISSGDFADVTGYTAQGALQVLNRLAGDGVLRRGEAARGRRAHFVKA